MTETFQERLEKKRQIARDIAESDAIINVKGLEWPQFLLRMKAIPKPQWDQYIAAYLYDLINP